MVKLMNVIGFMSLAAIALCLSFHIELIDPQPIEIPTFSGYFGDQKREKSSSKNEYTKFIEITSIPEIHASRNFSM